VQILACPLLQRVLLPREVIHHALERVARRDDEMGERWVLVGRY